MRTRLKLLQVGRLRLELRYLLVELNFGCCWLVGRVSEVSEAIFEVEGAVEHVAAELRFPGQVADAGRADGHPLGLTEEDSLHGGKD